MNQFFNLTMKGIICAGLMMGSLIAADEEDQKERVPCRVRQLSIVDHLEVQEERALRDQEIQEEAVGEQEESQKEERVANAASYYTSHEGAYHALYAKTLFGDCVEIEDGSRWLVKFTDRHKTVDWLVNDILLITPNYSWFSTYAFCLHNINTGACVEINMYESPYYNGIYTRWIKEIDYINNQILLDDGSVWDLSFFDHSVLVKWLVNDTVVIGINDGLFSGVSPNILINVTTNPLSYVTGKCIY